MKTIGLLGGMSWESTLVYYRAINEGIGQVLGGLHSAEIIMYSVDFEPIQRLQHAGEWEKTTAILKKAAGRIEAAGADFLLLCTNTMHRVATEIEAVIRIPLLHIADTTAEIILQGGMNTVGLLGTEFTMEGDFYKGRLEDRYGIGILIPGKKDRQIVHEVIYDELCLGRAEAASRTEFLRIIDSLAARGAEAVILGCTEIGLLIGQADTETMILDTTVIHAQKAVACATEQSHPFG